MRANVESTSTDDRIIYACLRIDDHTLSRIRSDRGVEMVDCKFRPIRSPGIDVETRRHYEAPLR
jgi:hypothetical protein